MYKRIFSLFSLVLLFAVFSMVSAQSTDVGIAQNLAGGEVTVVSDTKISIQTKDGAIDAILSSATAFKRIPPETPSFKSAVAASLSDISVGDKVVITGLVAADKKTMPAKAVYLMTKADITKRNALDAEKWRTRGVNGKVVSVDPQTNQVGIEVRGLMGPTLVTVKPKEKAKIRRYAENSVDFNEAKASSLTEISKGDMLRAVGDRSADGTTFDAEELVTGAFQTVAGTVKSIDAAKNEVVITDFNSKKDLTIAVAPSTTLKKIPADMAQRLAAAQMGGGPGMQGPGTGPRPPGATPPGGAQTGAAPANGTGAGPGRGMGGRGGIDDMLERFDTITIADLKAGDVIAASSTKTANAERITAIKLVSGVEPFLKMAQMAAAAGGQRGGQGGVSGSFTIPGLDGFGGP